MPAQYPLTQVTRNHNQAFVSGLLAISATAEKFKTVTNTIVYTINGVFYSKAPTDNLVFSSGHTSLAAGQSCYFVVALDTSGNVSTYQGPIFTSRTNTYRDSTGVKSVTEYVSVNPAPTAGSFSKVWPNAAIVTTDPLRFLPDSIPDTVCPIGSILVASGVAAFVPNTTALTGLGTYANYSTLPVPSV